MVGCTGSTKSQHWPRARMCCKGLPNWPLTPVAPPAAPPARLLQQITDLPFRPPPLLVRGLLNRCFGYLAPVFLLTDGELMQTAGIDALVSQRLQRAGGQGGLAYSRTACLPGWVSGRAQADSHSRAAWKPNPTPPRCPVQMLCRFVALGVQIFAPLSALCCAVRESPQPPPYAHERAGALSQRMQAAPPTRILADRLPACQPARHLAHLPSHRLPACRHHHGLLCLQSSRW